MKIQNLISYFFKLLQPRRIFLLVFLVLGIYLLPLGSKPEFVEHNGQIISVSQPSPILQSVYPEGIYATCGQGGTGTNCQTGCCSAGACVVCPQDDDDDQPPSISANLNCSDTGNNGWCMGTLTLNLNASDPQGANVLITGTLNGNNFACPSGATSCSIPVTQETATGAITYRVDASTGLAAAGSASYKLDATTPTLNGSLSGVAGTNSWYRSTVTLNVTSSDSLSGLATTTASINGGTATAVTGPLSFSDGISSVIITATDNAGNTTQTTQTIQVDTITPSLSTALSGTSGSNGWYVSTVTITPSASDAGSGLSNLEVSTDGNPYTTYIAPITFTDGIHTYQFRATDTAGNVTQTVQQTVKVDTTTPSISLNIAGTNGKNGWYISNVTVTPILSDSTAGIAALEAVRDGGAWTIVNGPLSFTDGLHSYQFMVTDQAGNSTTIPIQNLKIDTIAPFIDMTAELSLGETVYYALEDYGSGLELYHAVIEDEAEQYQKIVWLDLLDGNKLLDQIRWDGKFKDGTPAGNGEYFITLKISDEAGNETMKTAVVSVNFLSFLQDIPAFTIPESTISPEAEEAAQADSPAITQFGGENNTNVASDETITTNEGGNGIVWPEGTMGEVEFNIDSTTTTNSFPLDPNILWGAAATALAGATLAEWERQREEERKRRESEEAKQQKRENTEKRRGQKAQEDAVRERWAEDARRERANDASTARWEGLAKIEEAKKQARINDANAARWAGVAAIAQAKEQERLNDVSAARWAGVAAIAQAKQEEENKSKPWEKVIDWVDQHQIETSIGVGAIVAITAIVVTLAVVTVVTLPVILTAAAIATVAAAVTVAAGTVALNNYYDRPPTTNIISNVVAASATAAILSGAGLLAFGGGLPVVGNAVSGYCITHPGVCTNAGVVLNLLDKAEETALRVQLAIQTATGNPSAGETALELQMESMDGGIPGNSAVNEFGEQLAKLSDGSDAGGVFSNIQGIKLEPYTPTGPVVGQLYDYSCVSASCAALLNDPDLQEGIMKLVGTNSTEGASIGNAVTALSEHSDKKYTYIEQIDFKTLQVALENGPAIISVNTTGVLNHAIVVDSISDGYFHVRDPWPTGENGGSSYKIRAGDIWDYWVRARGAVVASP